MKTKSSPSAPAAASAPVKEPVGESFGDFRIVRRLGQGGMGEVFLAEQVSLGRKVAIKVLREDLSSNAAALARFTIESKTVAQINHANVVQVFTIGKRQGRSFMVLEYVEGKSLAEYLARQGRLEPPVVLSLMRQLASALQRAGDLGIVHRDIKPANILLTRKGQAKIADFGLARCRDQEQPLDLTRTGTTVGTPLYMSPEQIEGKPVDARSDIYSFGVTCYHMLAGQPPFTGENAFEVALKHVREEPPALERFCTNMPPGLSALIRKMMAKKPSARYQSAQELLEDISRVREALQTGSDSVTLRDDATQELADEDWPESSPLPLWKRPAVILGGIGVLAASVLTAVLAAVLLIGQGSSTAAAPQPEPRQADLVPATPLVDRQKALEQTVAGLLAELTPNPAGLEDCIALGVLYLKQNNVAAAKSLFARMDERRAPSAYHFVGSLGLAVTDALEKRHRESHARLSSLFDPKSRDNRVQVLNDALTKNPELAQWVNETRSSNARSGAAGSSHNDKMHRFTFPRTFRKPGR